MRSCRRIGWGAVALLWVSLAVAETPLEAPVAKRVEHRVTWHGETFEDDYFWLRERSNPAVVEYLQAENAYTAAVTQGQRALEETLYQEMLGRIKQTDLSVPARRGGYAYYQRTVEGQQYAVQCRRQDSSDGPEQVLLDLNELARGYKFLALGAFVTSDDQRLLAYTTDTSGFRQFALHVKDLATGGTLPDTAQRVTSVAWSGDHQTLFFTTEDPQTKRSNELWRHKLGAEESTLVYREDDELFSVRLRRTSDRKFVLLQIESAEASEVRFVSSDQPDSEPRVFMAREANHRYRVDHREGLFYVVTNKDAKDFRVVTTSEEDPGESKWQDFVPHRPGVLVQNIDLFQDYAVVTERSGGLNRLQVFDFTTRGWHGIDFREPVYAGSAGGAGTEVFSEPVYAVFSTGSPEFEEREYRYTYQSPVMPPTVFDYDMKTRQPTLVKQNEVLGGYDSARYESGRLWATARDGTRVPLSVVYKKGVPRDGSAPLLLYGYGSYGFGVSPTFSSERISLLDRGVVFAIAHVRGGNELGESWREAGMRLNKKNTFHDFIDCAEYLIKEKWTSPERLAIEGASAGGLLMGAVVNERPDLFRAVHAGVPFVDVLNTMMDASLPLTTGEYLVWGNPNEKTYFDYMRTYSPYDNLRRGNYPAMLVTTGLNDSQVMYWEPAKYVARLRTLKTDDRPLLLKTNMGAGHGGASGRYDRLREQAFEYAWFLNQLGIAQ